MDYIAAPIPQLAADLLTQLTAKGIANVTLVDITQWLQNHENIIASKPLSLSQIRPDYDSIRTQLISALSTSPAWNPILTAGGGETILEFLSAIGALAQASIYRSLQEDFLDTARLASGIYTICRMLGVHITRMLPATVTCSFTNDLGTYILVPRFSQFIINSVNFFNRDALVFTPDQPTITADLYQGTVTILSFVGNGHLFQRFEIGQEDFSVSDQDIYCFDDAFNQWKVITDGLWHYAANDRVIYQNSTPNGNAELVFGNNIFGMVPPQGQTLNLVYVSTLGNQGNSTVTDQAVNVNSICNVGPDHITGEQQIDVSIQVDAIISSISGKTISNVQGGQDERDNTYYRVLAPYINSAKGRMVRSQDHYALALEFPNLIDVYFQGQRQLAPKNRNFINVVGVTTLMSNGLPMDNTTWVQFVKYLDNLGIWRVEYLKLDPTQVVVNVVGDIFVLQSSDIPKVGTFVEYSIRNTFKLQLGSLGRSLYRTDLTGIMTTTHHSIRPDYAELATPATDVTVSNLEFITIGSIDLNVQFSARHYAGFIPPAALP